MIILYIEIIIYIYDYIKHIGWCSIPNSATILPKELFHQDGTGVDGEVGEVLSGGVAGYVQLQHLQAIWIMGLVEVKIDRKPIYFMGKTQNHDDFL